MLNKRVKVHGRETRARRTRPQRGQAHFEYLCASEEINVTQRESKKNVMRVCECVDKNREWEALEDEESFVFWDYVSPSER
jgi:DNA replicative helicase MCM subunit Mcm2 (Cdc46/Mcm family)